MRSLLRRSSPGLTLVEVLTSIVITTLIFGVLVMIYSASMRIWRHSVSVSTSFPPAYTALNKLSHDLRNAVHVNVDSTQGTVTIYYGKVVDASVDTQRHNDKIYEPHPLEARLNDVVQYYISDDTGVNIVPFPTNNPNRLKRWLWRRELSLDSTGLVLSQKKKRIAENVTEFSPAASTIQEPYMTKALTVYSMAITVLGEKNNKKTYSQFSTNVYLRSSVSQQPPQPIFTASPS